jgi:RHS repeat-associated protein
LVSQLIANGVGYTQTQEHLTGDGTQVVNLKRENTGFWPSDVTVRDRVSGLVTHYAGTQPLGTDPIWSINAANLARNGKRKSSEQTDGFKMVLASSEVIQEGVEKTSQTFLDIVNGTLVVTTFENGRPKERRTLDATGRVLAIQDAVGALTKFSYDVAGRLIGVATPGFTDANHQVVYDRYGRISNVWRAEVGEIIYDYQDGSPHVSEKLYLDVSGHFVRLESFSYDAIGRVTLIRQTADTGEQTAYAQYYDGKSGEGQLGYLTEVSSAGFSRKTQYDPTGAATQIMWSFDGWLTATQNISYASNGSVLTKNLSITHSGDARQLSSRQWNYGYDAQTGHLSSIALNNSPFATASYRGDGALVQINFGKSGNVSYSYDLVSQRLLGENSNAAQSFVLQNQFNADGFIASQLRRVGDSEQLKSYDYDARGFLMGARVGAVQEFYNYNTSGLLTDVTTPLLGHRVIPQVHLGTANVGNLAYAFDSAGRLRQAGDISFGYGPNGRVSTVMKNAQQTDFIYDETGVRVLRKRNSANELAWIFGGTLTDAGFRETVLVNDMPVAIVAPEGNSILPFDHLGTLLASKNGTANFPTAYGERSSRDSAHEVVDFAGSPFESSLQNLQMGVRDLDPYLGEWTTPDPLFFEHPEKCVDSPVECNLYSYARNNPVMMKDPSGKVADPVVAGSLAIVGGFVGGGIAQSTAAAIETAREGGSYEQVRDAALSNFMPGAIGGATTVATFIATEGASGIAVVTGFVADLGLMLVSNLGSFADALSQPPASPASNDLQVVLEQNNAGQTP